MQNIALPNKIKFEAGDNPLEGIISVEPLFPGYGMTLGNAIRRVLLSSLPGAAVIGVKVKGASHEFMALPNIKEDVLELILNLKQLRFKIYSEEEIRLELKVSGKKTVTAADITKNSQVEIKNLDLVLAHITDAAGVLDLEIIVKEGRGYKMAEHAKKENKELGYIQIDSIFSPVSVVSIEVKNTRVGKMTNWDKLILRVKTDGTISVEEAFNEAVKILVHQYNSLLSADLRKEENLEKDTTPEEVLIEVQDNEAVEKSLVIKTEKEKKNKLEKKSEKKEKKSEKKEKKSEKKEKKSEKKEKKSEKKEKHVK